MAIKEIRREWSPCQLDYVKEFLLHSEADVKNLPACCVGSKARVSETGNVYTCSASGEWTVKDDGGVDECESAANKVYVTDGNGKPHWDDRLAYSEGFKVKTEVTSALSFAYAGGQYGNMISKKEKIVNGETYSVLYNGNVYSCVAWFNGTNGYYLGNRTNDPNGEPFLFVCNDIGQNYGASFRHIPETGEPQPNYVTIQVVKGEEVIKTIDPKFLPGGSGGGGGGVIYVDQQALSDLNATAYADATLQTPLTYAQGKTIMVRPFIFAIKSEGAIAMATPLVAVPLDGLMKIQTMIANGEDGMSVLMLDFADTPA